MFSCRLKDNSILKIREASMDDAASMISHAKIVGDESPFLSFSSADFRIDLDGEKKIVEEHLERNNQIFILGFVNEQLVSMSNMTAGQKPRSKHLGEFGISVLKDHWGKGIATHMIQFLIDWAKQGGVLKKINLSVLVTNKNAIKLYEKLGFEMEGCERRASFQEGQFFDAYYMGMLI